MARADEIEHPKWKALAFARLAGAVLEKSDRAEAAACVDRALTIGGRINDVQLRADTLIRLLDALPVELVQDAAHDLLTVVLLTARDAGRDFVFGALTMGAPLLASVDRGETLWHAYKAVVDVETWWGVDAA